MKKIITIILVATLTLSSAGAFAMSNNFVSFQTIQQSQSTLIS